jgi:iron complex transport system substrate-binding protein
MNKVTVAIAVLLLAIVGCSKKNPESQVSIRQGGTMVPLKYAKGFAIETDSIYTRLRVKHPFQGAKQALEYLLVPTGAEVPHHSSDVTIIRTPIRSIVCTSTTHIPILDYLGVSEALVGFPTTDYISSKETRKLIDEGKVKDLGVDKGMNIELLSSIQPQLVMAYSMNADFGQFKKITELGIPVLINSEYLEQHPLGRAEWIKFVSTLFNKEHEADSIFESIERAYLSTQQLAAAQNHRPTVLSGIMYGDAWFLPGGQNYAATILNDAGFDYLWREDGSHGFLELSFEQVYEKANDADFWIGVGTFQSMNELKGADHRYEKFQAFRSRRIYNYDARKGAKGGNEYLELGYLRPDIILMDLVKISNPTLLPDYELYFHRQLTD